MIYLGKLSKKEAERLARIRANSSEGITTRIVE